MSNESENFDTLKKLLSLKSHEQPPPGFFRDLPGQVLQRIAETETRKMGWWSRLTSMFEFRPAVSIAYGSALCGLLVAGIYFGRQAVGEGTTGLAGNEVSGQVQNPFNVSTGELSQPPAGIFDPLATVPAEQVRFETNRPTQRP